MQHEGFNLDEAVAILTRTPATLSALLAGVPERWMRATEGEGEWSPYEVVAHLINGERTNWMPRARHILMGQEGPFASFDQVAHLSESQDKSVAQLLTTFAELRRDNIAALVGMNLTNDDLRRKGQHPALGQVTLQQLLATWVVHDLGHLEQIVRAMAQVHADEVGPWRVYLAILHERE